MINMAQNMKKKKSKIWHCVLVVVVVVIIGKTENATLRFIG